LHDKNPKVLFGSDRVRQAMEIDPEVIPRVFNFIPATKEEIENGSK